MFEVRILSKSDGAMLENIAFDVFDDELNPQLTAEFLDDERHHLAVAMERGQVIGFASGVHYVHPDKPPELWIVEVGVAPPHQRRGVGRAVVEALLQHGQRLGCKSAWVLTERANEPALRLYASAGGDESREEHVLFTFDLDASS